MAGDHGIVSEGVSLYPQDVTPHMILNFLAGGAGINVLSRHGGIRVVVTDLGIKNTLPAAKGLHVKRVGPGTRNMAKGPAMTRDEAVRSIEAGIEVFEEELISGLSIVGTGDMGIGNTTPSSAITAAITGRPVARYGQGDGAFRFSAFR
jgi:nicotinate-nucleotide--dimethylbenzimidazole phosphoribosyltransferase